MKRNMYDTKLSKYCWNHTITLSNSRYTSPNNACGMTNSADHDQAAPTALKEAV